MLKPFIFGGCIYSSEKPLCKNFEAKERMGVYYFREGTVLALICTHMYAHVVVCSVGNSACFACTIAILTRHAWAATVTGYSSRPVCLSVTHESACSPGCSIEFTAWIASTQVISFKSSLSNKS